VGGRSLLWVKVRTESGGHIALTGGFGKPYIRGRWEGGCGSGDWGVGWGGVGSDRADQIGPTSPCPANPPSWPTSQRS
jgi:hypothetical protein